MLSEISSGNAATRRKYLTYWYFEDQLKEIYANFVMSLNKAAQDTLDVNKEKAIGAMHQLLMENPEQEKNLLTYIVNKLGDPSQKVASKAIYCLNQLLYKHSNMQGVVLSEIEKLLFRSNVAQKAQYYGICFLSQFYLSHESADVARKLIELYFAFFKSCIKQGEVDSRMMSALLMGVNRAYPYAKLETESFSEHIDTMYRIVHIANFNVSLHALTLLYQVSGYADSVNDRFYSALYKKLLDSKLTTTTHQAIFLNLVYKALMKDNEMTRTKAFIKRLLQITLLMQPPFACGVLYLISQLMYKKQNLQAFTLEELDEHPLSKFENDEEEKYVDVPDNEDVIKIEDDPTENVTQTVTIENSNETNDEKPDIEVLNADMNTNPSWYHCTTTVKQEKPERNSYDPFCRNPLYAGANHTAYLELLHLKRHYHPTVSLYAEKLLNGTPINYSGDPLKDFSLIRFLDRFVFKNPKKLEDTSGSHPTFGVRKKYKPIGLRSLAINSDKYLRENEKNIPVDEVFLYKYMQKKQREKRPTSNEDSDLESVASEEFEEILDKMTGHKELDDDLDYMNEIGNNLITKSNKKVKDVEEGSDESDMDDDDDLDDEDDIDNEESDKSDDNEADEDDDELIQDLDNDEEDNASDIVFESNDSDDKKIRKKLMKKSDFSSVFASAEEFASLLDDEGTSSKASGSSNAFSNKDKAATKQIAWEEKRNQWLQGYNKAVGKKGNKHEFKKYNGKRTKGGKFNNNSKKRKIS